MSDSQGWELVSGLSLVMLLSVFTNITCSMSYLERGGNVTNFPQVKLSLDGVD